MSGRLEPYFPDGEPPRPPGSWGSRDEARDKIQRGLRSVFVRLRRAGVTFVGLFAALVVYTLATGGIGFFTFLLAMAAIFLMSLLVITFPVRDRSRPRPEQHRDPRPVVQGGALVPLNRLAAQTEDWLMARARALPNMAGPSLDRIVGRLRDFQPALDGIAADTPLGGEAKRLIGEHLPDLVTTYLSLPPGDRHFQAESSARLAESLGIVADQMDDLCERLATQRRLGFETERRFIESRYRDDGRLSLDR